LDFDESARMDRFLTAIAVEKTLLEMGKPVLAEVNDRLKKDYNSGFVDCFDHPEYLSRILCDLFGDSYEKILESITANLGEHKSNEKIVKFLQVMKNNAN